MDDKCVFCKIYTQNMNVLYKDARVFVILDIRPLSQGHLLVIPIKHGEFLYENDEEDVSHAMRTIWKIVRVLGIKKFNILQNNGHIQSVPHVHFHIVPYVDQVNCLKVDWKVVDVPSDYVQKNVARLKEELKELN
ncbi:Zinc-binding protein of the histidine triad (HIT) family [Trachipleistophora hominis]|uniref:Zinc-binding protein of the histidine triad (HIT) family n=1 Tax=Trachipleistophora hominis TaxID=72359 RepID=L7JU97_TRAHO|nr:Zinc-binding protein of the histidine triad (HIT) family [Trachipleistophora hominis]